MIRHEQAPTSSPTACVWIVQIFFSVYEMAIDTVLLSFCEDCESNNGHPRCAPALLLEAVGEAKQAPAPAMGQPVQHQGRQQWT